jgi:hypothetical protein
MKFKPKFEDMVFLIIVFIYVVLQTGLLMDLVQVPSPLYGGDYYHSHGAIQHVLSGGNPLLSSNTLGTEPGYLPLYTLLVGGIGVITGVSAFTAMKAFSFILMIGSLILFYVLAKKLFRSGSAALTSTLLYIPLTLFPVLKYRQFTVAFIFPLFFLVALNFYKKRDTYSTVLLGVATGVVGISHSAAFIAVLFFLLILGLYMFFFEHVYEKRFIIDTFKLEFRSNLFHFVLIAGIGFLISLLYWYRPLFVHHLSVGTGSLYNIAFTGVGVHLSFIFTTLKEYFLNFTTGFHSIRSALFLLGVLILPFIKKYTDERRFIVLILVSCFVASFHHLITEPVFKTSFSPIIVASFIFVFVACIMAGFLISLLEEALKGKWGLMLVVFVGLILFFSISNFNSYVDSDVWMMRGWC